MELASIIGYAMIKMMFLLAVGFAAAKGGVLDEERSRAVNALLMNVLVPALIISGFTSGYDESKMRNLMLSLLLSCLGMGLSVLITNILIRRKGSLQLGSERGNAAFPNVGFLGIPLVQALYGAEGVLYIAMYTTIYNMIQWSYGDMVISGKFSKERLIKAMLSPMMVSSYVGLVIFFLHIPVPDVIAAPISSLGACCSVIPMLLIGSSLTRCDIRSIIKKARTYIVLATRLLIVPAAFILAIKFMDIQEIVKVSMLIPTACPPAAATTMICLREHMDDGYPSAVVGLGTILSVATIPLVVLIFSLI